MTAPRKKSLASKTNPLSKFHRNCQSLQKIEDRNRKIAGDLDVPLETLNDWWQVWNEERPVRTFIAFVGNQIAGEKAEAEELQALLIKPQEKWATALKADKARRLHRALGVLSHEEALSALTKRSKLSQVKARLSFD